LIINPGFFRPGIKTLNYIITHAYDELMLKHRNTGVQKEIVEWWLICL